MTANENQLQIERLVDGELSFEEEVKLLQAFAEHPSGWKQLATAFLEDRTFRASLAANAACSSDSTFPSTPGMPIAAKSRSAASLWNSKPVKICAACAVLLAAFLSGRYSATDGRAAGSAPIVVDSNPVPASGKGHIAGNDVPQATEELPPPIEFVSLNVGAEGEEVQTVDVPLLPLEQVSGSAEADEMEQPPSLIPDELRELLARRGQTVREYIDYYQFELSDGRVAVIPVSNIEIQANTWPPIQ